MLKALEDIDYKMVIKPEDFQKIDWKYPAFCRGAGLKDRYRPFDENAGQGDRKRFSPIPYIHVEESGVAFCAIRLASEEILGLESSAFMILQAKRGISIRTAAKKNLGQLSVFYGK